MPRPAELLRATCWLVRGEMSLEVFISPTMDIYIVCKRAREHPSHEYMDHGPGHRMLPASGRRCINEKETSRELAFF